LSGVLINGGDIILVGYIATGSTTVGLITRVKSSGDVTMSKRFGSSGSDIAYSVSQCRDGGYVVAASSTSFSSKESILILRFNSHDEVIWVVCINGGNIDSPRKIIATRDGGFVVVGFTTSVGVGTEKGCMIKLSNSGHIEWARAYGKLGYTKDNMMDVLELPGGGFRVVGDGKSYRASGSFDVFMAQITDEGEMRGHPALVDMSSIFLATSVTVVLSSHPESLSYVNVESAVVTSAVVVAAVSRSQQTYTSSTCTPDGFLYSPWPSESPSEAPFSSVPSCEPSSTAPAPSSPSSAPFSSTPTALPSGRPTTQSPTSSVPSEAPSSPTLAPTPVPSFTPGSPTPNPSRRPTAEPTMPPTSQPTVIPTTRPTRRPTSAPTAKPTAMPSCAPTTASPSAKPSIRPTKQPSAPPTLVPTSAPTLSPTITPTVSPTIEQDGYEFSGSPSVAPTSQQDAQARSAGSKAQGAVIDTSFGIILTLSIIFCVIIGIRIYSEDKDWSFILWCVEACTCPKFLSVKRHKTNSDEVNSAYVDPETGEIRQVSFVVVPGGGLNAKDAVIQERHAIQPIPSFSPSSKLGTIRTEDVDEEPSSLRYVSILKSPVHESRRGGVFFSTESTSQAARESEMTGEDNPSDSVRQPVAKPPEVEHQPRQDAPAADAVEASDSDEEQQKEVSDGAASLLSKAEEDEVAPAEPVSFWEDSNSSSSAEKLQIQWDLISSDMSTSDSDDAVWKHFTLNNTGGFVSFEISSDDDSTDLWK
jgi:hypothetical protein